MKRSLLRPLFAALLPLAGTLANPVAAQGTAPPATNEVPYHWRVALSPYSLHFRPSDEHESVYAIGLERQRIDGWLLGASYFSNSFGQPSAYAYVGKRYDGLFDRPQLFWQWSAGLMYGYTGKYEDKVPLNYNGFSPGALLSIGWQFDRRISAQINTLGDAGLMFQVSVDLR